MNFNSKTTSASSNQNITVCFIENDVKKQVQAPIGHSILDVAREHGIDLEGACEGSLACSTCHVVLGKEWFDLLPQPEIAEEDMLDFAHGLTQTSRLGCQVILTKELDGIEIEVPSRSRNLDLNKFGS